MPAVSQVLTGVRQPLRVAHQLRNIRPALLAVACCWQKDLQLIVLDAVGLPQLNEPMALV